MRERVWICILDKITVSAITNNLQLLMDEHIEVFWPSHVKVGGFPPCGDSGTPAPSII